MWPLCLLAPLLLTLVAPSEVSPSYSCHPHPQASFKFQGGQVDEYASYEGYGEGGAGLRESYEDYYDDGDYEAYGGGSAESYTPYSSYNGDEDYENYYGSPA